MFGSIGGFELLLILVVALLVFGPRKLPQIGRTLGRTLGELRRATTDFRVNLDREVGLDQIRESGRGLAEVGREVGETIDEVRGSGRDAPPEPDSSRAAPETQPSPPTGSVSKSEPADPHEADGTAPRDS